MHNPKGRGRPRLDPTGRPATPVQVKLTAADYQAVCKVAADRRESVQTVIRRGLRREISSLKL